MKLDQADSVEVVEQGPVRTTIRVTRHWQQSKFVQDISLYAGLNRVDIGNEIDWHETHVLLKAAFPLAASSGDATYEIPYGTIDRPTARNNRFEIAKFEVPALRWADLGDGKHGLSLINESKYGYDGKGNVLRISLLRSPTWPDPEADRGHHSFRYSLYPHTGDWKQALTVRCGYEFNYKLLAFANGTARRGAATSSLVRGNRPTESRVNCDKESRGRQPTPFSLLRVGRQGRRGRADGSTGGQNCDADELDGASGGGSASD